MGQSNKGHCDVPRFEALVRDNTSTPADLNIMEDHTTKVLLELYGWRRRGALALFLISWLGMNYAGAHGPLSLLISLSGYLSLDPLKGMEPASPSRPPRAGGAPGAFISQARGTKVNEVACCGSLVARLACGASCAATVSSVAAPLIGLGSSGIASDRSVT